MHLDSIFKLTNPANNKGLKVLRANSKTIWERAVATDSDKGALTSFRNTRRTGGDGVTYPAFSASKVLPYAKIFGKTERTIVIDGKRYVVPDDVELVESLTSDGTASIDTGIYPANTTRVSFMVDRPVPPSAGTTWCPVGVKADATNGTFCTFESTSSSGNPYLSIIYGLVNSSQLADNPGSYTRSRMSIEKGVLTYDDGKKITYTSHKDDVFTCAETLKLFRRPNVVSDTVPTTMYDCDVDDDTRNIHLRYRMGVKNGVGGVYEVLSGKFIAPTSGTLTPGKKTHTEKTVNLFNAWTDGEIWNTSGGHSTISGWQRTTDMIPVKASTAYTIQCLAGANSGNRRVYLFDANKAYISEIVNITGSNATLTETITTTADTAYLTWQLRSTDSNMMLVEGSTAPSVYIPPTLEVPITELYGVGDKTANSYGYQVDVLLGSQGVVDLGTLACRNYFDTSSNRYFFAMTLSDLTEISGVVCSIYTPKYRGSVASLNNMEISVRNGLMYIRNDSFDASTTAGVNAFKSAMSGVYFYYQRNTDPTWQPPTPYTFYTDRQLHGIDYEDVLVSNNDGTGSITSNMGIVVFDGSDAFDWKMSTTGSVRRFYTEVSIGVPSRPADSTTPKAVCNYPFAFDKYTNAGSATLVDTFNFGISDNYVRFGLSTDSEIDSIKKWEANLDALKAIGKPLTLIVPLAEADATPLTGLPVISLTEKAQYTLENTNLIKGEVQATCLTS